MAEKSSRLLSSVEKKRDCLRKHRRVRELKNSLCDYRLSHAFCAPAAAEKWPIFESDHLVTCKQLSRMCLCCFTLAADEGVGNVFVQLSPQSLVAS